MATKPKGYDSDKHTLLCTKRGCTAIQSEDGEFCTSHSLPESDWRGRNFIKEIRNEQENLPVIKY